MFTKASALKSSPNSLFAILIYQASDFESQVFDPTRTWNTVSKSSTRTSTQPSRPSFQTRTQSSWLNTRDIRVIEQFSSSWHALCPSPSTWTNFLNFKTWNYEKLVKGEPTTKWNAIDAIKLSRKELIR